MSEAPSPEIAMAATERCEQMVVLDPDEPWILRCHWKVHEGRNHQCLVETTKVNWNEDDRRSFAGEWERCPKHHKGMRCRLPYRHRTTDLGNGHQFT